MKRLFVIVIFCMMLSSCAYHGALNTSGYNPQSKSEKIPVTVALGDGGKITPIQTGAEMGYSFNVETKEAVMSAAKKVLSNSFSSVGTSCVDSQYIAEPSYRFSFVEMNGWTSRYSFDSEPCLLFYQCGRDGVVVEHCDKQRLDVYPPGSSFALSVITGLSLFILSPITMPIQAQILGDHAVETVSKSLYSSFDVIQTDTIRNRNKFIAPVKEEEQHTGGLIAPNTTP